MWSTRPLLPRGPRATHHPRAAIFLGSAQTPRRARAAPRPAPPLSGAALAPRRQRRSHPAPAPSPAPRPLLALRSLRRPSALCAAPRPHQRPPAPRQRSSAGLLATRPFNDLIKYSLDTAKLVIEDDTFYTLSLLKKGVSHAFASQDFICCICNLPLTKGPATSGVRVFNCGHSTHLICESEQTKSSHSDSSVGCPICLPKKNTNARNKSINVENGLVKHQSSSLRQSQGINLQYLHEPDVAERPRGLHQIPRSLHKAQKPFQVDILPQVRLSPPAIYHEKVQKGAGLMGETSNSSVKSEKKTKQWQLKELKSKGV
ncbi:hypothetical protein ACMD2_22158, partial [Ananas comosus]